MFYFQMHSSFASLCLHLLVFLQLLRFLDVQHMCHNSDVFQIGRREGLLPHMDIVPYTYTYYLLGCDFHQGIYPQVPTDDDYYTWGTQGREEGRLLLQLYSHRAWLVCYYACHWYDSLHTLSAGYWVGNSSVGFPSFLCCFAPLRICLLMLFVRVCPQQNH